MADRQPDTGPPNDVTRFDGLGIAAGIAGAAALLALAPRYLGIEGAWGGYVLLLLGGCLGLIAVAGAVIELSNLARGEAWKIAGQDLGVAAALVLVAAIPAGIDWLIDLSGGISLVLRMAALMLVLFVPIGLGQGFARLVAASQSARQERDADRVPSWLGLLTAVLGLGAALANLLVALTE